MEARRFMIDILIPIANKQAYRSNCDACGTFLSYLPPPKFGFMVCQECQQLQRQDGGGWNGSGTYRGGYMYQRGDVYREPIKWWPGDPE